MKLYYDFSEKVGELGIGKERPQELSEAWEWLRNPLPPDHEHDLFRDIRDELQLKQQEHFTACCHTSLHWELKEDINDKILKEDDQMPSFVECHNPIIRHTVLRSRIELEEKGLLQPILLR